MIQDGRVDIQTKNSSYNGNGNRNAGKQNRNQTFNAGNGNDKSNQKPRIRDAKYFKEQMLLAMKDEAGSNLKDKENDFMLENSKENASPEVHEQVSHVRHKTIIHTSDDEQIDSNIIFDDPYMENNGGTFEHDSNAHDEFHKIQMLAYTV
nr:hypothetical protein [Tanacetum cinerariifolium]